MARAEDIRIGACLVSKSGAEEPLVIRKESNGDFLTYDGENDKYVTYSLQSLIEHFDCVDHVPEEDCIQDVERYVKMVE